jgi:hypothetical protein
VLLTRQPSVDSATDQTTPSFGRSLTNMTEWLILNPSAPHLQVLFYFPAFLQPTHSPISNPSMTKPATQPSRQRRPSEKENQRRQCFLPICYATSILICDTQLKKNKMLLNIVPLRLKGLKDVKSTANVKKLRTGTQNTTIQVKMDQKMSIAVMKMTPLYVLTYVIFVYANIW